MVRTIILPSSLTETGNPWNTSFIFGERFCQVSVKKDITQQGRMNEHQFGVYLESLALLQREEANHRREETFLKNAVDNMITSNGLNTAEFRKWNIRVKSNAAQLKNNHSTVQLMQRTATGALQEELDTYIWNFLKLNPEKQRQDIPWHELLDHITRQIPPFE